MFITRHFKKVYIFTICILIISQPSFAHECLLKDTTPKEITIYNTCLSQQDSKVNSLKKKYYEMERTISKLENDNIILRNKLLNFKKKIYDLLNNF